jgi:class 3 adenylate cyclase
VLVSEEAKRCAVLEDVRFESLGDVTLKGLSAAVRLHRASRGGAISG